MDSFSSAHNKTSNFLFVCSVCFFLQTIFQPATSFISIDTCIFSQSKTRHQFILYSNNVSSSSNEFIDYKIEPFYLDNKHVSDLIDGISEEAIKNIIAEAAKKQEVEDLFK